MNCQASSTILKSCCCCTVAHSCLSLCDPMDYSTPGLSVLHHLPELLKLMFNKSAMPSNHLILCCPLLLLPLIFPSIRVFSSESALGIRWPNYWSFSISPSNEESGLISFRIDWFDLLAACLTKLVCSPAPKFESINSTVLSFLSGPALTSVHDFWKNHSCDFTVDLCQQSGVSAFQYTV